ncbi:MAG TPA: four helix bundle protein [Terriglobales bacterium]|jgi:four helix bundle protein|nr:four helix bundle protein [Terriglobales bacterium]
MNTQPEELRDRSKAFALRVIRLFRTLPYRTDTQVLGKQLLRCGTAVAANYRAACRSRSKVEFIARIGVVAEEVDEAVLWLELLTESGIISAHKTDSLLAEARELADRIPANCEEGSLSVIFQLQNY